MDEMVKVAGKQDRTLDSMAFKSLVEVIEHHKTSAERGITFIHGEKSELSISYANLYSRAVSILFALQERGLKPGDELISQLYDTYDFLSVFWACLLGKIIPIPLSVGNNDEHRMKLFNVWRFLQNPHVIASHDSFEKLEGLANNKNSGDAFTQIKKRLIFIESLGEEPKEGEIIPPQESDIAFIQFSSG
ncbi:MAG: peptide synthetase, partial [bacterium]